MTLTPLQWDLIYRGIPHSFSDGSSLHKFRSKQFVPKQDTHFPLCVISIITQGIPVDQHPRLLDDFYDDIAKVRLERWGYHCRARISAVIEALSIPDVERLSSLFSQALYDDELGINPIVHHMQFRGVDPPQDLPPYYNPLKKANVQRVAIDFFVEYEFSWVKTPDLIREVRTEIDGPRIPLIYQFDKKEFSYLLDAIILRS
jgi:hypothetical protein